MPMNRHRARGLFRNMATNQLLCKWQMRCRKDLTNIFRDFDKMVFIPSNAVQPSAWSSVCLRILRDRRRRSLAGRVANLVSNRKNSKAVKTSAIAKIQATAT